MSEIIGLQAKFFIASVASGIIMLIVYDILRILRRIIEHSKFMVALEDVLFWILSSVFIFMMMYIENDGIIRGFSIMGMLLGMIIYNLLLSKYIVNGISFLLNKIIEIIKKIIYFLLSPFRFVIGKILKFLNFIRKKVVGIIRFVLHKLNKLRKYTIKLLKKIAKTFKISITKR
ncbi:spore cortex biosynthesis protein YabQ [Anaeromicropila herbilytica]|nr:spore cortex biosynthesis protein YabQ [Anaeromicropila herbilytica]